MKTCKAMQILNISAGTSIEKMLRIARQNVFFDGMEEAADCIILYCLNEKREENRQERQAQMNKELEVYFM